MTLKGLLGKQVAPIEEVPTLRELYDSNGKDPLWAMLKAYTYGYIQGKRAERARRKT